MTAMAKAVKKFAYYVHWENAVDLLKMYRVKFIYSEKATKFCEIST